MLTLFSAGADRVHVTGLQELETRFADAYWIDVFDPSLEEERALERVLHADIPTRLEMAEIEASSRLYTDAGALVMTAMVLCKVEGSDPESSPMTFILAGGKLVTLRYHEPLAFRSFCAKIADGRENPRTAEKVLALLIDAFVDRLADILEEVGMHVDTISRGVFTPSAFHAVEGGGGSASTRDFQNVLQKLGRASDLLGRARESLVSFGRLNAFWAGTRSDDRNQIDGVNHAKTVSRDISSLTDHASFLASKISFLLDATLGLINVEQNNIIKVFSVLAVIFLPPTLIGTIYGMNFEHMPELRAVYGYPIVLFMMVLSAVIPYQIFKRKGWY